MDIILEPVVYHPTSVTVTEIDAMWMLRHAELVRGYLLCAPAPDQVQASMKEISDWLKNIAECGTAYKGVRNEKA